MNFSTGDGRLFALGLGLFFLGTAIVLFVRRMRFVSRARSVDAEVLRVDAITEGDSTRHRAIFRFVTHDGQSIESHAQKTTREPAYTAGEHVRILYDPADPGRILAPGSRIAEPVLAIAGLLFVLLAFLL